MRGSPKRLSTGAQFTRSTKYNSERLCFATYKPKSSVVTIDKRLAVMRSLVFMKRANNPASSKAEVAKHNSTSNGCCSRLVQDQGSEQGSQVLGKEAMVLSFQGCCTPAWSKHGVAERRFLTSEKSACLAHARCETRGMENRKPKEHVTPISCH